MKTVQAPDLKPARVAELMHAWDGRVVGVLGDVMLDRYVWGKVTRISPEAPVPVVEVERESYRLGGAANVAKNLLAVGVRPVLFAVTGMDDSGTLLRGRLEENGLNSDGLAADGTRPTTVKTRIVAQSQHLVRVDEESSSDVTGEAAEHLVQALIGALPDMAAMVISDYGKGVVTSGVLPRVLAAAKKHNVPVCVDPKDTHFFSYRGVSVVTPNQHEAAEVLGFKLRDEAALNRAGIEIQERLGAGAVLITRGEHGMSLFEQGTRTDFMSTARHVYDVTGAGDTVTCVYAAALSAGASPVEAAWLSNRAAGQVVAEIGTAVPDMPRLLQEVGWEGS